MLKIWNRATQNLKQLFISVLYIEILIKYSPIILFRYKIVADIKANLGLTETLTVTDCRQMPVLKEKILWPPVFNFRTGSFAFPELPGIKCGCAICLVYMPISINSSHSTLTRNRTFQSAVIENCVERCILSNSSGYSFMKKDNI